MNSKFYTNVALFRSKIHLRYIEDGIRKSTTLPYKPYLFVDAKGKKTKWKNIKGEPVDKIEFENAYEQREFVKKYENVEGFNYYGMAAPIYTFINDNSPEGPINYDPSQISVVHLDIEVDSENGFPDQLSANRAVIAIALRKDGKNVVFGMKDYKPNKDTNYIKCVDEIEMFKVFLGVWNSPEWSPDIITGWNVEDFDIAYLVRRIRLLMGEDAVKLLSPWRSIITRTHNANAYFQEREVFELVGISILDYMLLYKKFSFTPQESYRLDHIAKEELSESKLDYSMYRDLNELYQKDPQRFFDYNIHDVELIDKLEEKKGFIRLIMAMAYDAKVNFTDTLTTVKPWDVIIHNHLMSKGIVVNSMKSEAIKQDSVQHVSVEGAYVKDSVVGFHDWIVNFDLNSLYPHLVRQYNISMETLVGYVPEVTTDKILNGMFDDRSLFDGNVTVAASGCKFTREFQGILPFLMEKMYTERVMWKKRMIEAKKKNEANPSRELEFEIDKCKNMQHSKKIFMNSLYGALGNCWFRWYDQRLVSSITISGQVSIRWVEDRINIYLNKLLGTTNFDYVVAADTDSLYLRLGNLVGLKFPSTSKNPETIKNIVDYLDNLAKKEFEPMFQGWFKELAIYVNAYSQNMEMKRETICQKGLWTGKKHYALNAWDIEGVRYHEPELKITGLESVRSSTPSSCRVSIKQALKIIMNKEEKDLQEFIAEFDKKFRTLPIEEISFPRSLNGLQKYYDPQILYKKGTPVQVKGSLIMNQYLKENNLTNEYQLLKEGEKIKFCYLKQPNPLKQKVISFNYELPKGLDLKPYIDYDLMLEKAFIAPIKNILTTINWSAERRNTIDSFFE